MNLRFRFFASTLLMATIGLTWWMQSRGLEPVVITPSLTGEAEYCISCHPDVNEISPSHPVESFGCIICHGGERLALDEDLAHSSMRGGNNPSDLSVVEQSCGGSECHSGDESELGDHIQRVKTSIQTTYAGAIANVRFAFGAQDELTPILGTMPVKDTSLPSQTGILFLEGYSASSETHPLLQTFGENCLGCHLNSQPMESELDRYSGCAACHSPADSGGELTHTLTTAISYSQCNNCHNQGNYELITMTFVERSDQPLKRQDRYYQPIAQFTQCEYTLDCVDCHTRIEIMGDGDIHASKKDIQYVQCKTCHGTLTELPQVKVLSDPNDIVFRLARLNAIMDLKIGDTILETEKGESLWNIRLLPDGSYEMIGKATRQLFHFNAVLGSDCEQDPGKQESQYCHECHAVEH
ncbi:hypothetical protein ACFLXB_00200 [Chloroflexota bacterium]